MVGARHTNFNSTSVLCTLFGNVTQLLMSELFGNCAATINLAPTELVASGITISNRKLFIVVVADKLH